MPLTKIDDRGLTTPVDLLDNEKIRFGTGNDLQIYHGGTNTVIQNSTGDLYFKNTNNFFVQVNDTEAAIYARPNGAVELYHNGTKKFETTSAGTKNTGVLDCTGSILLTDKSGDNIGKLRLGNGPDLQIYHDGTNSLIYNTTGELQILTNGVMRYNATEYKWNNGADSEKIANFFQNGACELYFDHSKKLETTSTGATITGDLAMSGELNMVNGGNYNRFIDCSLDNGEALFLRSTNGGDANHQNMALFHRQGSVELYHAAAKKFETTSGGVSVTGTVTSSSHLISGGMVDISDNNQLRLGNSQDMMISHDGSSAGSIRNATGELYLRSDGIRLVNNGNDETYIKCIDDGAVELYHNNNKKLETNANGILFRNNGTLNQNQLHFERGTGTGDYSTIIGVTNYPDSPGYSDQDDGYWAHIISKGGAVIVLNSDGAYNSGRNTHDHFSIYQKAGQSGTTGRRLFSVDNIGAVQFGLAGIKIDREWGGQPSISVQRNCNDGTDNTDDSAYFRFHGTSQTHESWTGAGSPGADFSVNLLIDGSTYATNSDRRRKTDIVDCPYGLDVVNKLQPRKFHIVNSQLEKQNNGLTLGFIAQEIKEHIPESVDYLGDEANTPNEKGWASAYAFGISEVIPVLTKSIQELSAQVKTLQAEVEALKAK